MESLYDMLSSQLGQGALDQIARQVGGDRRTAEKAVPLALGSLMGALAGNASERRGAEALSRALDRDHDGGILDDLSGFLGSADTAAGAGILEHVLGSRQEAVAVGIGQKTGLDGASVQRLLAILAPLVLGALGKAKRQKQLEEKNQRLRKLVADLSSTVIAMP